MNNRRSLKRKSIPEICEINDVKTVKQSTYYYCAAACLRMCLDLDMSQDEIYKILKETTKDRENWYAEPDAVYAFLSQYEHYLRTSAMEITSLEATEWILSCMIQKKISAPMLVSAGKHWVLYTGYQINHLGTARGIYIRDPWPTTASLSFYAFSGHFFDEYFCKINVDGNWKDRVEAFISPQTKKCIALDVHQKPAAGGLFDGSDIAYFKQQIIQEDLAEYGFGNVGLLKHGGALSDDCIIEDGQGQPRYLLSYVEVDGRLNIAAIEIRTRTVIAMLEAKELHFSLFDRERVITGLSGEMNKPIRREDISFVYDGERSSSCFDPIVRIKGLGDYSLLLQPI